MHISVDRSICTGHGRCYALAPSVYESDDDGYCVVTQATVGDDLAEQARVGALNCPEDAITVTD